MKRPAKTADATTQPPQQAVDVTKLVPLPEAAVLADVSPVWLRTLFKQGKVIGLKIGRNFFIDVDSARAFQRHPFLGRPRIVAKPAGGGKEEVRRTKKGKKP
jgi:hypothetical protein